MRRRNGGVARLTGVKPGIVAASTVQTGAFQLGDVAILVRISECTT